MNAPINFHEMAQRDPAIAALMGAIPGYDFGYSEPSAPAHGYGYPAPQPGAQFGDDYGFGGGQGSWDYHGDGDDYGWGFGAAPGRPPAARRPMPQNATAARTLLLDPNRGSTVKVERYSFSFSPTAALVLGTASAIATFTQQPSASIKGQRVLMNAPQEGFVFVSTLQIANVNVFIGSTEDAFNYNARAQNSVLDLPRLDPQNRATSAGSYSGVLPPGFSAGASFTFIITLQGPATLAGGYGQ